MSENWNEDLKQPSALRDVPNTTTTSPASPQSAQLGPNVYRGDDGVDRVLGISSGSLPQSDQPAPDDLPNRVRDDIAAWAEATHESGDQVTLEGFAEWLRHSWHWSGPALEKPTSQQVAPAPEGLREAASKFAARVRERCPEWFEESDTDFSEADHALRATLAQRTPTAPGKGGK